LIGLNEARDKSRHERLRDVVARLRVANIAAKSSLFEATTIPAATLDRARGSDHEERDLGEAQNVDAPLTGEGK